MAEPREILLGNGWHTLFSDEVWYLVVSDSGEIALEARFDTDAPERSGWPNWLRTEFCVSNTSDFAVCRVPYGSPPELLAAVKLSFVPKEIWDKAVERCQELTKGTEA
jgi:hypothetical protein